MGTTQALHGEALWALSGLLLRGQDGELVMVVLLMFGWINGFMFLLRLQQFLLVGAGNSLELRVMDLIDAENGCWNEALVKNLFLDFEPENILSIPLCEG